MPMQRVQILLRNLPPMLADILYDALSRAPEFELLTASGAAEPLQTQLDPARPCVIVQGLDDTVEMTRLEAELAASVPSRRVIAIEPEGRRGVVCELRPSSVAVGELALDRVVDLVRGRGHDAPHA
jgi:hypothetical protein